ncbi:MAG: glycosyl hydrolase-related protein [Candidatus Aminicenantes bacterium]|nr:glycosyl hydrolase-related protein [Candidatus Aminicenantes bacterium]
MKKLNYIQTTIVLFMVLLIPLSLNAGTGQENIDKVLPRLQAIDGLVNPPVTWKVALGSESPPNDYKPGEEIKARSFTFQTSVKGVENFCGVPVQGTPMHLKLTLYSKGYSEIEVRVGGKQVDTFTYDGSSWTEAELEKEIMITPTTAAAEYNVEIKVENKGFKPFRTHFWPPRKKELAEDYSYFYLKDAQLIFPAAAAQHGEMKDWLLSMKIAYALLYPDFKRYTFIGEPFNIEDHRKTPKPRLDGLKKLLEQTVTSITPEMLIARQPEGLEKAIRASYRLSQPLREFAKEFKLYLIGNAHIDIAWLWRMCETVMVARNTYDTILKNMEEYPELRYAQSQAVTYEWMEQKYPEIFEKIKLKVKQGQWEIVGGMWVEPDCNLISGESWVRQLLFGKRYFKEKFGLEVETGWNPDSFGYNWNMPQLYTKSGIKRFITQKIRWNDTTVFPYFIFWWQGVDDTRLMTYFPPVGYTALVRMPGDIPNITRYEATTGYKKTLLLYGLGDHGGGPNREILNRVRSYKNLHIAPEFIHSPSIDFLKNMTTDLKTNIPVWKDELYLEYHRGTYTTQAKVKKGNRKSESMLSSAEKLASIAFMMNEEYPQVELGKAWKTVLTNQFHDILPGSSIMPVYRDALEDYEKAGEKIKRVIGGSLKKIAGKVDTSKVEGTPLVIFNTLSWERTDLVSAGIALPADGDVAKYSVRVLDDEGKEVPVEIIPGGCGASEIKALFVAKNIPGLGYKTYSYTVTEKAAESPKEANDNGEFIQVENKFFTLKINKKTGNIAGLLDKRLSKEFVEAGKEANVLQVYEDRPENWDAWNIGYTGRWWELDKAESAALVEDSAVRKVVKVTKNFLGLSKERYSPTEEFPSSFFTQYIILYNDLDRIDIETEADWWEEHMLLKAAFPVSVKNDYATYEIPFASIKRTTRSETLWEKARFEVPGQRWADLSDETGGISLLNDCKYGYDIHANVMKISLLRAPTWPDPMADRGKHTWIYSLYTHPGDVTKGNTVQRAQELNIPLRVAVTDKHSGTLPGNFAFFEMRSGGVILDTIKKAEDDNGIIIRFYESAGKEDQAELVCFKQPRGVYETDLMEKVIKEQKVSGKTLLLKFKKFEIKSLKLIF